MLRRHGEGLLWEGAGASEDGARPFIDLRGAEDGAWARRLWRGAVGCYDNPYALLSASAARRAAAAAVEGGAELLLLSRRQSQTQPPQLLLRGITAASSAAADGGGAADESRVVASLSDPPHPQPGLIGVRKQLIKYTRADGTLLSGTLLTPAGRVTRSKLSTLP